MTTIENRKPRQIVLEAARDLKLMWKGSGGLGGTWWIEGFIVLPGTRLCDEVERLLEVGALSEKLIEVDNAVAMPATDNLMADNGLDYDAIRKPRLTGPLVLTAHGAYLLKNGAK
jgi:hypothetical protein